MKTFFGSFLGVLIAAVLVVGAYHVWCPHHKHQNQCCPCCPKDCNKGCCDKDKGCGVCPCCKCADKGCCKAGKCCPVEKKDDCCPGGKCPTKK
jgi:hypothetical protein